LDLGNSSSIFDPNFGKENLVNTQIKYFLLGIATWMFFMACASTKLTKTWMDEAFQGHTVSNVLIIGVTQQDAARRMFEDVFVSQLKHAGIRAISSVDVIPIPADQKLNKEIILATVQIYNNDSVIITYLIDVDRKGVYTPPQRSDRGIEGHFSQVYDTIHQPGYYKEDVNVRLETNLYDVKTEKLIWTGQSESMNPKSDRALIVDVVKIIVKEMQQVKILPES
jgi:hypothetical protein